jgi:hypothetical protein
MQTFSPRFSNATSKYIWKKLLLSIIWDVRWFQLVFVILSEMVEAS